MRTDVTDGLAIARGGGGARTSGAVGDPLEGEQIRSHARDRDRTWKLRDDLGTGQLRCPDALVGGGAAARRCQDEDEREGDRRESGHERRMPEALRWPPMSQVLDPRVDIGHVHLKVADLDRALAFWRDTLGFEEQARMGDQAAFSPRAATTTTSA